MINFSDPSIESQTRNKDGDQAIPIAEISSGKHSFRSLGPDFFIETEFEYVPDSKLVLFNKSLARELNLALPEADAELEQVMLENFAWYKCGNDSSGPANRKISKRFISTRYLDSEEKSEGHALGDGRAVWVGEIIQQRKSGKLQYIDVVLKGIGPTELAWLKHPNQNHKDGQAGLTEAVHEYIYSLAAKTNGIRAVGVLAVIKLPKYREASKESAAIVVRAGNHLRFAHYCYFADNPVQLKKLFDYGLKKDLGLPLTHSVTIRDVHDYLDLVVTQLASDAAIYFDVHGVHGSPTFGNVTSCGGTVDFSTFVYIDAHHGSYSYMPDGANRLGGEWGQTEQFFNLFSSLVDRLKKSRFDYEAEIRPIEYFLRKFNDRFEQILTKRWLLRIGLSKTELNSLSKQTKEYFYENVKTIYELSGSKKIKLKQKKVFMAAFEPRKILSATAGYLDCFDDLNIIWHQLFKVNRHWGTFKLSDARPHIKAYQKAIINIADELNITDETIAVWQYRSQAIELSERNEPGVDFFYDSERFFASQEVLHLIQSDNASWQEISEAAQISTSKLVDHGLVREKCKQFAS